MKITPMITIMLPGYEGFTSRQLLLATIIHIIPIVTGTHMILFIGDLIFTLDPFGIL